MDATTTPLYQPGWLTEGTPEHWFDIYNPDKHKPPYIFRPSSYTNYTLLRAACKTGILVPVEDPECITEYCISWTMVLPQEAIDEASYITPANFNDSTHYFKFSKKVKQKYEYPLTSVCLIVNQVSDYTDVLGQYLSEKEAENAIKEMEDKNYLDEQGQKMWMISAQEADIETTGWIIAGQCLIEDIGMMSAAEHLISTPIRGSNERVEHNFYEILELCNLK